MRSIGRLALPAAALAADVAAAVPADSGRALDPVPDDALPQPFVNNPKIRAAEEKRARRAAKRRKP